MKKRIGIVYGGKSGEHEVSVQSAENIRLALDRERYEPVLIGIDKQGVWRLGDPERSLNETPTVDDSSPAIVALSSPSGGAELREIDSKRSLGAVDVFFPIAHGTFGEDGSLQGLLRLLGAPFVGADVLGSAVGMDKDVMKRLFRDAALPVSDFLVFRAHQRKSLSFDAISKRLGLPLFVKPCNLGSSVGISKVATRAEFERAVDEAFLYDRKIILEENVVGREIECAVLGNDAPQASVPGEILLHADFYSYEAKYVDADGAGLQVPALLDEATALRVRELAVAAFEATECRGMARVDVFLKEDGAVLLNEINTLPGFTRISMYPKLWEASGIPYGDLLSRLIELATESHESENALRRSFMA